MTLLRNVETLICFFLIAFHFQYGPSDLSSITMMNVCLAKSTPDLQDCQAGKGNGESKKIDQNDSGTLHKLNSNLHN